MAKKKEYKIKIVSLQQYETIGASHAFLYLDPTQTCLLIQTNLFIVIVSKSLLVRWLLVIMLM